MNIFASCEKCDRQEQVVITAMGFSMPEGWSLAKRVNTETGVTLCADCSGQLHALIDESYATFFGRTIPVVLAEPPSPQRWRRWFSGGGR